MLGSLPPSMGLDLIETVLGTEETFTVDLPG